jgi:hypothetical protein
MNITITDFCNETNNWFEHDKIFGAFRIEDGCLDLTDQGVRQGQYIRIVGSVFNDGVHLHPACNLVDEEFSGAVWVMAVPSAVITLVDDIDKWSAENASAINSPYQSESFGGYSYTKPSDKDGDSISWQSHFRKALNGWRKV